jgi:formate dehydrogenase
MKVYAAHEKIQNHLINNPIEGITIVDDIRKCHYLISGKYSQSYFNPLLKGIIIPYTGHNAIDLKSMRDKELKLFIISTRTRYVAEKAVALTLALLGNTINYHTLLKKGNWSSRNSDKRLPWVSIQGLSVGLFGYGRIGDNIHKMLKGFDCEFYTIDRGKTYPEDIFLVKNLTNLVQVSDIIIIAAPLNRTTEEIFNQRLFSRMKSKYLINVGRGNIIDEKSLYDALKNSTLKGYASDVWYNYPKAKEKMLPSTYPIYEMDNVVLSNHSGGFTTNTNIEVNEALIELLIKLRDGNFEEQLDLEKLI